MKPIDYTLAPLWSDRPGFSPAVASTLRAADAELTARERLVEDVRREGLLVALAKEER